jgi:hypothetical protein
MLFPDVSLQAFEIIPHVGHHGREKQEAKNSVYRSRCPAVGKKKREQARHRQHAKTYGKRQAHPDPILHVQGIYIFLKEANSIAHVIRQTELQTEVRLHFLKLFCLVREYANLFFQCRHHFLFGRKARRSVCAQRTDQLRWRHLVQKFVADTADGLRNKQKTLVVIHALDHFHFCHLPVERKR